MESVCYCSSNCSRNTCSEQSIFYFTYIYVFATGDEFWLGLDNIYELTQMKNYTLRITMERFDGVIRTAFYTNFKLLDNVSSLYVVNTSIVS